MKMNKCHECKKEKPQSEMFLLVFRKLGIQARYGVKIGYSRYYCDECLKEFDMYEEVKNAQ